MSVYVGWAVNRFRVNVGMAWKLARRQLLIRLCEAQNQRCAYCRRRFGEHGKQSFATLDHLQTKAHGGRDSYSNCVAACANCNNKRGIMNPSVFARTKAQDVEVARL